MALNLLGVGLLGALGYHAHRTNQDQQEELERARIEATQARQQADLLASQVTEQTRELQTLRRTLDELYTAVLERDERVPGATRQEELARAAARELGGNPLIEETDATRSADADPKGSPPDEAESTGEPVTRAEVQKLVKEQLAAEQKKTQAGKWGKEKQAPRRTVGEVSQELHLRPRQESDIREVLREHDRATMRTLFQVEESELESLKGQLDRARYDQELWQQLRERVSVNWVRHSNELSVLWVQRDAGLRRILGQETLGRFYESDVQLEEREFPDVVPLLFPEKAAAQQQRE